MGTTTTKKEEITEREIILTTSTTSAPQSTRRTSTPMSQPNRARVSNKLPAFAAGPGLQCYSCGNLFDKDSKCDSFNSSDVTQVSTCLEDESCLLYSWEKSDNEVSILRQCFPRHILLGPIERPLASLRDSCTLQDITDDQSGAIRACLCHSDFCNVGETFPGELDEQTESPLPLLLQKKTPGGRRRTPKEQSLPKKSRKQTSLVGLGAASKKQNLESI